MSFLNRGSLDRARHGRPAAAWLAAVILSAAAGGAGASVAGTIQGIVTCGDAQECGGAVVYVEQIPGKVFPPGPEVVVDQDLLTFIPHVITVSIGTPVIFLNSDDVWHNVFSVSESKRFNLGTNSRGSRRRLVFDKPGVVELLCNVHPEMSAYIVVTQTPYAAVVKPDCGYALEKIPAGSYTLVAWREEAPIDRRQVTVPEQGSVQVNFDLKR